MKNQFGVYRSRQIILYGVKDKHGKKELKEAIFNTKREADLLCQEMNQTGAGYYVAPVITGKRIIKI